MTAASLARVRAGVAELARRRAASPLDFAHRLPWQEAAWSLLGFAPWDAGLLGPPAHPVREVLIVAANRTGKSTLLGQALAAYATGRHPRWPHPVEAWGGMPTLADSVSIQRPHVERWLGRDAGASWLPQRASLPSESLLRTRAGATVRLRAYRQDGRDDAGGGHWESGRCQLIVMDEPPPEHVLSAARKRLIDDDGLLVLGFTPLVATVGSSLFKTRYLPWEEFFRTHPGARWGEVTPGCWVISVGMRANARSVGGYLPDERIDQEEAEDVAAGKVLESRVRFHGEWIDTVQDLLIPVDRLRWWSEPPPGGWTRTVAWIDSAYGLSESGCETAIAVVSRSQDGGVYVREILHGRWPWTEACGALARCADVLMRHGCPTTGVQAVPGDRIFAQQLNETLRRRGLSACVREVRPQGGGAEPDKIALAQAFATMIAAGQVYLRQEHAQGDENAVAQMRRLSAEYLRRGGLCDTFEAVSGACRFICDRRFAPVTYYQLHA